LKAIFDRPAVAVLPFTNMSGDPEQEYFADGLTEDIITALCRSREFPVIARNSAFTYKGSAVKVQQAAEELGARYVLEGSVRKAGNRVRITMQFIDAATDHHVLAERYDRDLDDIFAVQDEITQNITAIIVPTLQKAEVKRSAAKQTDNLDAWDFYLRGMALIYQYTADENVVARTLFERAIALDPDYGRAHSGVAYSHFHDVIFGFSDDKEKSLQQCMDSARRAVALDDDDGFAHITLTFAFMRSGQFELALSESRKAMELDPTGLALMVHGNVLNYSGRPSEGIPFMQKGLELLRKDPRRPVLMVRLADAHLQCQEYEQAAKLTQDILGQRRDHPEALLILAATLGHLGQESEARSALEQYHRVEPNLEAAMKTLWFYLDRDGLEHVRDGLRKAGLPD
jgi:TolB-like protein